MINLKEYNKAYYKLNKHRRKPNCPIKRRQYYLDNIESELLSKARYRAKRDNKEFNLVKEDIIIPDVCPVLGITIDKESSLYAPSVDRVDNSRGYTKDNIIVISKRANRLKSDMTLEELKQIIAYIEKHK